MKESLMIDNNLRGQNEEDFKNGFLGMAKALSELQDRAVEAYRPLVDDICNRKAKEGEVDHLLTWMFDFVENEQMLLLFKKVCRAYFYTYPETVAFYILEYRKRYDRESLKGTKYKYLLEEDSVKSKQGTQVTQRLQEYILQGFTINGEVCDLQN